MVLPRWLIAAASLPICLSRYSSRSIALRAVRHRSLCSAPSKSVISPSCVPATRQRRSFSTGNTKKAQVRKDTGDDNTKRRSIMGIQELLMSTHSTVELQGEYLYEMMSEEARETMESPVIGKWIERCVIQAKDLPDAMALVLSSHIGSEREKQFDPEAIQTMLREICATSNRVRRGVIADLTKVVEADPAASSPLQPLLNFKGLHATTMARISRHLWNKATPESKITAYALQSFAAMCYGVDIHPSATIGDGVFLDHAHGVVIGSTAVLGDDIMILHGVTLGASGKGTDGAKRHPTVGSRSVLGALSTVLGDITIGEACTVGAQAVVTKNIGDGETVVGINNVLDKATKKKSLEAGADLDTWFYVV